MNEPVAWMAINKITGIGYIQKDKPTRMNKMDNEYLSLYTHPAKAFTDDNIAELIKATNDEIGMINIRTFDFVKVLLRKAQEK
jgi:hypothetical protein